MTTAGHITHLPLELTQKVALLCPHGDLVALGHTCRHLYGICNDIFVLQESFLGLTNTDLTSSPVLDRKVLRDLLVDRLSTEDPAQAKAIWARLAAAASRIPLVIDELETILLPYESIPWESSHPRPQPVARPLRNIIGVLSTLTVLGNPTINDFTVTAALTGLATRLLDLEFWEAWDPSPTTRVSLAAQVSFCLATGTLANRVLNNMPVLSSEVASLLSTGSGEAPLYQDLCSSFEGSQTLGLLTITSACWVLHSDPAVNTRDDLPYPPALPLLNVVGRGGRVPIPDGPRPFRESSLDEGGSARATRSISAFGFAPSWSDWLRNNIDVLIDDLPHGEWVGYYTNSFGRGSVDEPLRTIHFVTEQVLEDPDEVRLTASGCADGIGSFRLEGTVSRATGKVSLRKTYDGAHHWYNEGWLTPLGIAGYWGPDPISPFGFVWMYKKAWTKSPTPTEVSVSD